MLYPQQKERENRFKLALRSSLPTFLLIIVLFVLFFNQKEYLFFFSLVLGAVFIMVYYNLHVIYNGFNENMMDIETQVFNYKALKKIIDKEYKYQNEYTLLLFKMGDLESINAHYGRELANKVLRLAIKKLLIQIQEQGFKKIPAGYYGGGYFILGFALNEHSINEKLSSTIKRNKTLYIDDIEIELDSAMVRIDNDSFDQKVRTLIELVNCPHFDVIAVSKENDSVSRHIALELRIRDAIADESISLQYQSVKNANTDEVEIIEFSAKLYDQDKKFIHHSDIMPVINSLGLEKAFYLLVLKKIMEVVLEQKISQKFAISISAFALRLKELQSELPLLLREYEIRPGQMILEVQEDRYYKHIKRYKEIIEHYRNAGFGIALTNIGSNTPAIEYLKYFQVDYIKYDRHFSQTDNTILMTTIYDGLDNIMKERGIKRWAIMVEDESIEDYLKAKEIDYLQGWHVGKFLDVSRLN
ncbi:MAG: EAL domain-containing protein [Thiovulaceae bacterium]|nr:EAL domain-containing protein [Sulfurimonadaceae bacterium]